METSVVSNEPKRTLTRIEQCAADAAELPTLQASSGVAKVVLDMIDLIRDRHSLHWNRGEQNGDQRAIIPGSSHILHCNAHQRDLSTHQVVVL